MRKRPADDEDPLAAVEVKTGAIVKNEQGTAVQPPVAKSKAAGPDADSAFASTDAGAKAGPDEEKKKDEKRPLPRTESERRAWSIANLEKIGKALKSYVEKRNRLPPRASGEDNPMVSWRVLILPELGYEKLAARFALNEAWDGPRNKLLLEYMPEEYKSPERFDTKTNYLGIAGRDMAMGTEHGLRLKEITDGLENTLLIAEVDDRYAQEWTRPEDLRAVLELPFDKLGGLRGDGAFGVMGDGRVVLLPREMPPARLAALFTIGGGETIRASIFLKAPTPEPASVTLTTVADNVEASNMPLPAPEPEVKLPPAAEIAARNPTGLAIPAGYRADPTKEQAPDEQSLAKARELLKELYGKKYEQARTLEERKKFVKTMLAEAPNVDQNPSDFHELLRIVRDMATSVGDIESALAACEMLEQRFQVDSLVTHLKLLEELQKHAKMMESVKPALSEARRLARETYESDRYDVAIPAQELAVQFARMQTDLGKGEFTRIDQQVETLKTAKILYAAAQKGFVTLDTNPGDTAANEAVGRYLCFVKNRWEAGLPYLGKASDLRLRGIASLELSPDRTQQQTLALADQYWDMAVQIKQPQRRGLQLRALKWYEVSAAALNTSLEKVRVQRRIEEATKLYGSEEVERSLDAVRIQRGKAAAETN